MNALEKKMVDLLYHMRNEYHVLGVKGEFESEGARLEELLRLKEVSSKAGVEIAIKIGGCEAITDLQFARSIGASQIVAPMIESAYAVKKYINAARIVFSSSELSDTDLFINVETVHGFGNLDAIIALPEASSLAGMAIGRVDMAGSLNLLPDESNSQKVFEICEIMCKKWKSAFPDKKCVIGGLLNVQTVQFLNRMHKSLNVGCESKKVIFSPEIIYEGRLAEAFLKAIQFELMWYENCMENYDRLSKENWSYFKVLKGCEMTLAETQ